MSGEDKDTDFKSPDLNLLSAGLLTNIENLPKSSIRRIAVYLPYYMKVNNINKISLIIFLFMGICCFFACQPKSEYHQMVERELASGIRHDSLFYGFYLGMSSKEFYDHCWKMNKKGWFRQGANNQTVWAKITELDYPAGMDFYPTFYEDKIVGMPVTFTYDSWAPWSKHLSADSLKLEVVDLMETWYGAGFIKIEDPSKFKLTGAAYVKVDGNRRISVYNKDDAKVIVDFIDLTKKEEMEALLAEAKNKK